MDSPVLFPEAAQPAQIKKDTIRYARIEQPHTHKTDIIERLKKIGDGFLFKVEITYDMARDLLDLNVGNREFTFFRVKRYYQDFIDDRWRYTGDSLVVSDELRLINGQKRLWAFVVANDDLAAAGKPHITFIVNIVVGVPEGDKYWLDMGHNRTAVEMLSEKGIHEDRFNIASVVRQIYYLGDYHRTAQTMPDGEKMDNPAVIQWVSSKKRLGKVKKLLSETRKFHKEGPYFTLTTYTALWYLFDQIDEEKAEEFIRRLADGKLNLSRIFDSNIYLLRQTLMKIYNARFDDRMGFLGDKRFRCVMRVWNACRDGKRLERKIEIDLSTADIEAPR